MNQQIISKRERQVANPEMTDEGLPCLQVEELSTYRPQVGEQTQNWYYDVPGQDGGFSRGPSDGNSLLSGQQKNQMSSGISGATNDSTQISSHPFQTHSLYHEPSTCFTGNLVNFNRNPTQMSQNLVYDDNFEDSEIRSHSEIFKFPPGPQAHQTNFYKAADHQILQEQSVAQMEHMGNGSKHLAPSKSTQVPFVAAESSFDCLFAAQNFHENSQFQALQNERMQRFDSQAYQFEDRQFDCSGRNSFMPPQSANLSSMREASILGREDTVHVESVNGYASLSKESTGQPNATQMSLLDQQRTLCRLSDTIKVNPSKISIEDAGQYVEIADIVGQLTQQTNPNQRKIYSQFNQNLGSQGDSQQSGFKLLSQMMTQEQKRGHKMK